MITKKLGEAGSWIVVLCAVVTTIVVVRREFSQEAAAASSVTQPVRVDGWEEALAAGIRLGSRDAAVQIVEFADFECPDRASFEAAVHAIRDRYPDQVAFTLAHMPLRQHSFAESAARAAECADAQGRFEEMRTLLFEGQRTFGSVPWTEFAKNAAVADLEQFDVCVNNTAPIERVSEGKRLAEKLGVRGTPTIIVNGWRFPVTPSLEELDKIVKNVARGKPPV